MVGKAVMAMYEGAQTLVRTTEGDSRAFNVKVGLHQGSVLSPLLFVILMEMISRELRAGLPLELLYADDLILMAESEESLRDKIVQQAQLMLTPCATCLGVSRGQQTWFRFGIRLYWRL